MHELILRCDETNKIVEEGFGFSRELNPETDRLVRLRYPIGGILITLSRVRVLLQSYLKDGGIPLVLIS
jgi:hypothetical protein